MLIVPVIFRGTLGVKNGLNQAPVFKNLLQKSIFRQYTGFRIWNGNSPMIFPTIRKSISVSRFSKTIEVLDRDTRTVLNNVIIYKYEQPRAFGVFMVFAVVQLIGLLSMSKNLYNTFLPNFFTSEKSYWTQILENKFSSFGIFSGCVFGPVIFFCIFFVSSRTIRRIILHKGGQKVTLVTYHPIPSMRTQTVLLENLSCKNSRHTAATILLKIKGRSYYYYIDAGADFPNSSLFDVSVGVRRF